MKNNNIINLSDKRKEKGSLTDMKKVTSTEMIRIPIFERVYEVDGELMYELKGDSTPRKLADYSHMDFN